MPSFEATIRIPHGSTQETIEDHIKNFFKMYENLKLNSYSGIVTFKIVIEPTLNQILR